MQQKIMKIFFLSAAILTSIFFTQSVFAAVIASDIRPGFYFGAGYTYGRIKDTGIKDVRPNATYGTANEGQLPSSSTRTLKYSGASGFNITFGQLVTNNLGYELHYIHAIKTDTRQFSHYARMSENTAPNAQSLNTINATQKTDADLLEFLGTVAFKLDRSVGLYFKGGLAYEHTRFQYASTGIARLQENLRPLFPNFTDPTYSESENTRKDGLAAVAAAEMRYFMTKHVALSVAVNAVSGRENYLFANAGLTYQF